MKIILGSSSPRRQELLRNAGFEFSILKPDTPEIPRRGESPLAMVKRFTLEKAAAIESRLEPSIGDHVVITADTTVVEPSGRGVLNKPESIEEAISMLKKIQGRTHTVLTAYALRGRIGKKTISRVRVIKTSVRVRKLDLATVRAYVDTGEPMDKAGAYGAQGVGMALIESIRGSYTNVVGLPVAELVADLAKVFRLKPHAPNHTSQNRSLRNE